MVVVLELNNKEVKYMSKYNSYAKRLNDLFHDTASEYSELSAAAEKAKQDLQKYPEDHPGTVYDAKKKAAESTLKAAQEVFNKGLIGPKRPLRKKPP